MMKIPERRHRRRVVTLKNAAWFFGALLVVFIAYSTYNELRTRNASEDRLYQQRSAPPSAAPR